MILDIGGVKDLWYGDGEDIGDPATIKALCRALKVARKLQELLG